MASKALYYYHLQFPYSLIPGVEDTSTASNPTTVGHALDVVFDSVECQDVLCTLFTSFNVGYLNSLKKAN